MADEPTTGAMPGEGATPPQAGEQEPTTPPAGATPPAGTTADPAAPPPATGEETLGDAGKRVLAEARRAAKDAEARAKAAEEERDALKAATQTDQEKALEAARNDAAQEVRDSYNAKLRRLQVERALTAAGITPGALDLAVLAPEFADLTVDETGNVAGLDEAVAAFKATPERAPLFAGTPAGSADGGARGRPGLTRADVERMSTDDINARWPEVQEALKAKA
jgi:hypothetical protein